MKLFTIGGALALAALATTAQAATVGSFDSRALLLNGNGAALNIIENGDYNNVFRFDLAGITQTIIGATLSIVATGNSSGVAENVGYSVWDMTTDLSNLGNRANQLAAYTDAQSGKLYGTTTLATRTGFAAMPAVSILLNSDAIADLNAARGGLFGIGGNSTVTSSSQFLWLNSNAAEPVASLELTFAAIPLPAGLPMLLGALGALGLLRRVRRAA